MGRGVHGEIRSKIFLKGHFQHHGQKSNIACFCKKKVKGRIAVYLVTLCVVNGNFDVQYDFESSYVPRIAWQSI